jgi:YebC/PmpR family DNA-binding regulatory protein
MAGHSKFKKIKHKKGSQDAKRSNIFTKIIREITVAVKNGGGPNPELNPRLRSAMIAARQENMPKDKIETAIGKASNNDPDTNYEEMKYEGYGPCGTALIVECLTDNRNRTASDIRAIFGKNGGNLGEIGSVSYLFKKLGSIVFLKSNIPSGDDLLLFIMELGVDDYLEEDDYYEIFTKQEDFHRIKEALEAKFGIAEQAIIEWRPNEIIQLEGDHLIKAIKLLDLLEDNDDVQKVFYNFELPEEVE